MMIKIVSILLLYSSAVFAKLPLVIDTDMGHDDMMAIISLVSQSEIDVKAISICGTGLVHPKVGLENIRLLLATLQKDIPTAYGREYPFEGGHSFPEAWRQIVGAVSQKMQAHRESISLSHEHNAVELLDTVIRSSLEKVTVLALGPLTNLAQLFMQHSDLMQKIDKIYIMGGAFTVPGNLVVAENQAEWNIFADPWAAKIVIQSGIPIYLIPLDATNDIPLTMSFYEKIQRTHGHTQKGALFLRLLEDVLPWLDQFYFWDVVAGEVLINPSLAHFERHTIDIITDEGIDCGRTVFSEHGSQVEIAIKVDTERLLKAYCDML